MGINEISDHVALENLLDWLDAWRDKNGIEDGEILSDEKLEKFLGELYEKINNEITDFGANQEGYENAKLVLYTKYNYEMVQEFCKQSDGKYYMVNQTAASMIWQPDFGEKISKVIGEKSLQGEKTMRVLSGKVYDAEGNPERVSRYATDSGKLLSFDDFMSSKIVDAGLKRGNILYLIGDNPNSKSVGLLTELPELLNSANEAGLVLTEVLEIATNFTKGADGFVYDLVNWSKAGVCLDGSGKINYLDILECLGGENVSLPEHVSKIEFSKYMEALNNSGVFLDESGNIIGRSYKGTFLEGLIPDTVPKDYTYSTKYEIFSKFDTDAEVVGRWKLELEKHGLSYDSLMADEKFLLKELDYFVRVAAGTTEPERLAAATLKYIQGSGKTASELNNADRFLINFLSNKQMNWTRANSFLVKLQNSKVVSEIAKGAEIAGGLVTTVVSALIIYDGVSRSVDAVANGDYIEAAGILAGSGIKAASWLAGGEAATAFLTPYFAGAGMIIGGPAGAFFGTLLAGVIGYGLAIKLGDFVGDLVEHLGDGLQELYDEARAVWRYIADPLVIDLDGDGFEMLSVEDGVHFDEDNKGLAERTEWTGPKEGLLALDINGDGKINDGSELFGTSTHLPDGTIAQSGFEALVQYDQNGDGVIDAQDEIFASLRVWQDKNSNGVTDEGELHTLADLGITGISLETTEEDGRRVSQVSFQNGASVKMGEFDFAAKHYDAKEKHNIEITPEIAGLPNIQPMGNVESLHTMMQLDETGVLKGYVEQFIASPSRGEREKLLTKIIYFITGAENVTAGSRGTEFDAQKLAVIEAFMGEPFVGTAGANPVNTAAELLEDMYIDIYNAYYSLLSEQTHMKDFMSMTFWTKDESGKRYLNTDIFNEFVSFCMENGCDMTDVVADMARYISSVNMENEDNFRDFLAGYADRMDYVHAVAGVCSKHVYYFQEQDADYRAGKNVDIIFGGKNNDRIDGGNGGDFIYGGDGDDAINGESGDDVLTGGKGNDILVGAGGNDTYLFNIGDGEDLVWDYEEGDIKDTEDRIIFGEGITPDSITLERDEDDLIINYGEGDRIRIKNIHKYDTNFVEYIEFADGTVWEEADIAKHSRVRNGSARNDFMYGYGKKLGYDPDEIFYAGAGNDCINAGDGNDTIYGEDGDDVIYGESGDDILIGGKGNDILVGGNGNDTYIFNKGDGEDLVWDYEEGDIKDTEDRIIFGEGITPDSITLERDEDDLIINYGEGDRIRIKNIHKYDTNFVEYIEFADGTVWEEADIAKHSRVRNGSARNDFMYGYGKKLGYDPDEIFYAGAGNDCINAGDGNDTIYGEDGDDVIYGESGDDILIGGKGNDILVGGNGNDTYIFNKGDGEDLVWDYEEGDIKDTEDRIIFGEGITPDSITLERDEDDLVMNYGEGDRIRIRNVYKYDTNLVEYAEFADGTTCTVDYDNAVMNIISEKNDTQDEPCSQTECCMSDAELDNMVNILVQDMSEGQTDTVYDMESMGAVNNVDNVQLWVQ